MKYWVSVVSKEHALWGVAGGYMQACHGKAAPLNRMKPGDFFMFYCPATVMRGNVKVQKFLGLGRVADRPTYQFSMSEDFHPHRRDIEFIPGSDKLESALISDLDVSVKSKFRFGFFDLSETDFSTIVRSMGLDPLAIPASVKVTSSGEVAARAGTACAAASKPVKKKRSDKEEASGAADGAGPVETVLKKHGSTPFLAAKRGSAAASAATSTEAKVPG